MLLLHYPADGTGSEMSHLHNTPRPPAALSATTSAVAVADAADTVAATAHARTRKQPIVYAPEYAGATFGTRTGCPAFSLVSNSAFLHAMPDVHIESSGGNRNAHTTVFYKGVRLGP